MRTKRQNILVLISAMFGIIGSVPQATAEAISHSCGKVIFAPETFKADAQGKPMMGASFVEGEIVLRFDPRRSAPATLVLVVKPSHKEYVLSGEEKQLPPGDPFLMLVEACLKEASTPKKLASHP